MAELTATQRAEIINQVFRKGSVVEVSLNNPQFRKSWYRATVLRHYTIKIQVRFQNVSDPESNKPLIRLVDLERARPIPPPDQLGQRFHEGMKVDVNMDGGWWEGFIFTVHRSGEIFTIMMASDWTLRQFSPSEIRMHKIWEYNGWVHNNFQNPAHAAIYINNIEQSTDEEPEEHDDESGEPSSPTA